MGSSSSADTHGPSTETEPLTESHVFTSDTMHPTTGFFIGSDVDTFRHTAGASTASEPATRDESTESESNVPTVTLNPLTSAVHHTTASYLSTASSLPTGSRVCPVGAAPPGYCTPVQPRVTQTVSLPGIQQESENERPTAPRACWAFGKAKSGTWGRTTSSDPRQNSIEDCALLCKQEESACKAFEWEDRNQDSSCRFLSDTLGVVGIDINTQNSLMWNDFDCFECHDCDVKNPADVETTSIAPSTTSASETSTSVALSVPTACPHCHLKNFPSSDLVCEKIGNLGNVDLQPYANNDFDKATMQTTSEQCATICFVLEDCRASAYDDARKMCIFTNTAMSSSAFQEAQAQNAFAYVLPWSSKGCWSCSNDCSADDETTSQALSSTAHSSAKDETTIQSPSSTEHAVEHATITPTRTEPLTTFISSYAPTTTYSSMPECTLALSDGCQFDQNNYEYSQCSKSGTMRSTFVLEDGEYPWQLLNINTYQNCPAICNQMGGRCKASAWDQNMQQCVFSSNSIFGSSFTPGNDDGSQEWSDQSCFLCFCHDYERDDYSASLRTALPTATCSPSITSEDAVCQLRQVDDGAVVCQHSGYFPWSWDEAPSKFPNQDSEERCAALVRHYVYSVH
ncbi:unnamed protein product [Fusarium langsethiae]|nr:unnamed protein product [Fusarium langsethiae]